MLPFYDELPPPLMGTPEPEEDQTRGAPPTVETNEQPSYQSLAERDWNILANAMLRDKGLAAQVRRLSDQLNNDPNRDDKWAAYLYNTAITLEQRKYEEYLRTQEGMLRCKPWVNRYTNREPPDDDQAGGSNAHIYTILEESEPSEETIDPLDPGTQEDSEPCPQLTNEQASEETSRGNETQENEGGVDPSNYPRNQGNYRQVKQTGEQERAARPVRRWPQQSPNLSIDDYEETIRDRQRRLLNEHLGHPDPLDARRSPVKTTVLHQVKHTKQA